MANTSACGAENAGSIPATPPKEKIMNEEWEYQREKYGKVEETLLKEMLAVNESGNTLLGAYYGNLLEILGRVKFAKLITIREGYSVPDYAYALDLFYDYLNSHKDAKQTLLKNGLFDRRIPIS